MMSAPRYTGRFAPSPSGPLHFGSLVAAVAGYLDAKKNQGKWLLRIEDIDPPREQLGAKDLILKALDVYGLHWDDDVVLQSSRLPAYRQALASLQKQGCVYYCICTRKALIRQNKVCTGECYQEKVPPKVHYTVRLQCPDAFYEFTDAISGKQTGLFSTLGNCILLRKDGLFAYQLAVVVDDIWQNITHVVRGVDLLTSTPWQLHLFEILGKRAPSYSHTPLVIGANGQKLSKQHHAQPIPIEKPSPILFKALQFLQLRPPKKLETSHVKELILWGIQHWQLPKA